MSAPLYDCSVRTTVTTSNAAMVQLLPQASAVGTGRALRLREVIISNTTSTGFGIGIGIASTAGTTPSAAGTIKRRTGDIAPIDPPSTATVSTAFATTPAVPSGTLPGFAKRAWIPGNSTVVLTFNEGEELVVTPAASPVPFCVWNAGAAGQIADVTLTWSE